MATSSPAAADVWAALAAEAARESPLWADALRAPDELELEPVFSPLADPGFALGLETIYEGYLVHYGRPRLFAPVERNIVLLLGDYLYAHGLVRMAAAAPVGVVRDFAELISLCAAMRAEDRPGDGAAWAGTAALLGRRELEPARERLRLHSDGEPLLALAREAAGADAVDQALSAHARRLG